MRVLYLTNPKSWNQHVLPDYLRSQGEFVETYHDRLTDDYFQANLFDYLISDRYPFLIKEPILSRYKDRILNLHNSFLPYNRGNNPNFWGILEGPKLGGTLHYIDAGIDTGDIIDQFSIDYTDEETFYDTWVRIQEGLFHTFMENWPLVRKRVNSRICQNHNMATIHYKKDFAHVSDVLADGWKTTIEMARVLYHRKVSSQ